MITESLAQEFSYSTMVKFDLAIHQAYKAVNNLAQHEPFLLTPSLDSCFQNFYNGAVDYTIYMMYQNKIIKNSSCQFYFNKQRNAKYLKVETEQSSLTFSSSNNAHHKLPRPSSFRQQQSFENQSSLFQPLTEENEKISYGIILHKKNGPNGTATPFIELGIPDSEYTCWLEKQSFENLLEDHKKNTSTVVENIPNEFVKELENNITKQIKKNIGTVLDISLK